MNYVINPRTSKYNKLSIRKLLKKQKKINDEFEVMISQLTLEEIIALKLELASCSIGRKLYGFPIIRALPRIAQEAALLYSLSAAQTKLEAARFLGLNKKAFNRLIKKYEIDQYFKEQLDK